MAACSNDDNVTNLVLPLNAYTQTNLVANAAGMNATHIDANLVNPWGIAFGPTGNLWVANNGTSTSTVYDGIGNPLGITVSIPGNNPQAGAAPTGVVFNWTTDFAIPGGGPSLFLFAAEDGTISAWNSSNTATVVANRSTTGAVYKGLALAANNGTNFLYATNFKNNSVDVFDTNFQFVASFTDSSLPAGYAPFGITNIAGRLFVTFAKQLGPNNVDDDPGVGNGFVDVFAGDGSLLRRFASNGQLNSPWAVVLAPSNFGIFSGDILVGNFGDGLISAFSPTGAFLGVLLNSGTTDPLRINGLWGLAFGPGFPAAALYFSAGPGFETQGLVGTLTPR
jgi:uncharacterized protein (TIGR03118 family)